MSLNLLFIKNSLSYSFCSTQVQFKNMLSLWSSSFNLCRLIQLQEKGIEERDREKIFVSYDETKVDFYVKFASYLPHLVMSHDILDTVRSDERKVKNR